MGKDSDSRKKTNLSKPSTGSEVIGLQLSVQIVRDGTTLSLPAQSRVKSQILAPVWTSTYRP